MLALTVFPSHRIRLELLLEPRLLCTRRLEYDSWTSMLPDKSTPPQAETDLPLGRARIPANWSLQLVLYVAICVCVQRAASHSLTLLNPLFTRTYTGALPALLTGRLTVRFC